MEWIVAGVLVGILVVVLGVVAGAVAIGVGVVWVRRRRARIDPALRAAMLEEVGYKRAGEAWSRPVEESATIVFEEGRGWRWGVRLPRYNTMSLTVHERSAVDPVAVPGQFPSNIPELDARFVFSSPLAAQTVGLVGNGAVATAMLAMPSLSLKLGADELVLEDKELAGLQQLTGGTVVGTPAALAAEREMHQAVAVLVNQVFRCLYSRFSGTIMDEFR
jgi:hypothetical protein